MKNLILIFLFIILSFSPSFANVQQNADISDLEISLFGFDYKNETDAVRLDRIEKAIFGSVHSKIPQEQRIDKIKSAIGLEVQKETDQGTADWEIGKLQRRTAEIAVAKCTEAVHTVFGRG